MIMRRNPIILAFNIACLLSNINHKTLEFKLAGSPMGAEMPPPPYFMKNHDLGLEKSKKLSCAQNT